MVNILKFLGAVFILVLLVGGYFAYEQYRDTPLQSVPYPYLFTETPDLPEEQKQEWQKATVLIIGDRMARALGNHAQALSRELSKGFSSPVKVATMAFPGEGLHRLLARVKKLERLPKIILYHGASEEHIEMKFFMKEIKLIKENFARYDRTDLKTAIYFWPTLSRFIYTPYHHVELKKEITHTFPALDGAEFQKRAEISYRLFDWELEELVTYIQSKGSHLVLMTTPLNLDIRPKKVCDNAATDDVLQRQQQAMEFIQQNDFKSGHQLLKALEKESPGNAITHFLLGLCLKKLGELTEARQHMQLASAFDCQEWRSTSIHNAIIERMAALHEVTLYDFDDRLNLEWNKNILFFDDIYPQQLYYQMAVKDLAQAMAPFLQL